jgi:hypothetical protein
MQSNNVYNHICGALREKKGRGGVVKEAPPTRRGLLTVRYVDN